MSENLLDTFVSKAKEIEGVIDLTIGDPDITTPEPIIEEALADAKRGFTHYTKITGYDELIEALYGHYKSMYKTEYSANEFAVTASGCFALYAFFMSAIEKDDEVIIHSPYFPIYKQQIEAAGGKAVIIPTYLKDGFEIDVEILKSSITNNTKCIVINSPNNPTGAVFSKDTILEIIEIADQKGIYILSDEVYDGILFDSEFTHIASLRKKNTFTVGSFSKNFSMTGWRVGYLAGDPGIISKVKGIMEKSTYSTSSVSQRAALYAIKNFNVFVPPIRDLFKERTDYCCERLSKIEGIKIMKPKGAMYAFPDVSGLGLSTIEFCERFLQEEKVVTLPGMTFGPFGDGFVRIACTVDNSVMKEALDKLEIFAERVRRR